VRRFIEELAVYDGPSQVLRFRLRELSPAEVATEKEWADADEDRLAIREFYAGLTEGKEITGDYDRCDE
jgi:hypothetical protein